MSKRIYIPERGDVVEINFHPSAGREIDKRRPGVVLSPSGYGRRTGFCIVVPVTSNTTPGSLWVPMPAGLLPLPSLILCDYVRSFDFRERGATFLARVPDSLVDEIVSNLMDVIDPMKS